MRFLSLLFLSLVFFLHVKAQQPASINYSLSQKLKYAHKTDRPVSLFVEGNVDQIRITVEKLGGVFKYAAGTFAAVQLPLSSVNNFLSSNGVKRVEDIPADARPEPLNDKMISNNNVLPVHFGFAPLAQSYDGSGVVIGIIDTGIDFEHPDFKDENGKSRIKYIWNHTSQTGPGTPQPYGYGKEWTNSDIDNKVATHFGQEFHGTHVTGIASGNGLSVNNYKGVAPNADIIFVALSFTPPDQDWLSTIVDAASYIYEKAAAMGKPCVINASVGSYFNSHDGQDIPAKMLGNLVTAKPGRAFVCAGGNSGNIPFHLRTHVTSDTSFTWFKRPTGTLAIQIWADSSQLKNVKLAIGADVSSPGYALVDKTPFKNVSTDIGVTIKDSIMHNGIRVAEVTRFTDLYEGRYMVNYMITTDSTKYLWRIMSTGSGLFDIWDYDLVFDNLPAATAFPAIKKYVMPDVNQTIVGSFSCSPNVITVGNYVNRSSYTDVNGTIQKDTETPGALYKTSSYGPTRDGRIKPEITASGTNVLSCFPLSEAPWSVANEPYRVAPGGKHKRNGGTSMASPMVAGIAALYLQKYPTATFAEVKSAILNAAKKDQFTGNDLPNNRWGYGKVDAFKTLTAAATGVNTDLSAQQGMEMYPNPVHNTGTVVYRLGAHNDGVLRVSNILGETMKMIPIQKETGSVAIDFTNLENGVYFYSLLIAEKPVLTGKFVMCNF